MAVEGGADMKVKVLAGQADLKRSWKVLFVLRLASRPILIASARLNLKVLEELGSNDPIF